nr:MAG TPA: Suppressor of Fused Gli/Ci N terminal binding domain [Caudoviricetes sp.]
MTGHVRYEPLAFSAKGSWLQVFRNTSSSLT